MSTPGQWKNDWWKIIRLAPGRCSTVKQISIFVQRLMQEWGIYWWFEHSENSHTLVLADAINVHKACADSPLVCYYQKGLKLDKEFIHTITANESLRSGQWVLNDFDFMKPRSLLKSTVANPRETGLAEYEHYEWYGEITSQRVKVKC